MSEMIRRKAVLFDVDDTLYDQTVPFMEAYADFFGSVAPVPAEAVCPVMRQYSNQVYSRALAGEITLEEVYTYRMTKAMETFGVTITEKEALAFQNIYAGRQKQIHLSGRMEEILEYCSERAELGIITNGPSGHQWNKVKSLGVERWIPHENIFVSADVGAQKPDGKIFDHAKSVMHLEDVEMWFIGDSWELDVKGAVNAGWNAVWMNRREHGRTCGATPAYEVRNEEELFRALRENIIPES